MLYEVLTLSASAIDYTPSFDMSTRCVPRYDDLRRLRMRLATSASCLQRIGSRFRDALKSVADMDEALHDALYFTLFYGTNEAFGPTPSVKTDAETSPPRAPARVHASMPSSFASHARVLLATHSKRHSGRHGRRLPNGARSVGFIVDSGCSWHVH
eukprot:1635436-Pleurochrysis_carterae.AAC.1